MATSKKRKSFFKSIEKNQKPLKRTQKFSQIFLEDLNLDETSPTVTLEDRDIFKLSTKYKKFSKEFIIKFLEYSEKSLTKKEVHEIKCITDKIYNFKVNNDE